MKYIILGFALGLSLSAVAISKANAKSASADTPTQEVVMAAENQVNEDLTAAMEKIRIINDDGSYGGTLDPNQRQTALREAMRERNRILQRREWVKEFRKFEKKRQLIKVRDEAAALSKKFSDRSSELTNVEIPPVRRESQEGNKAAEKQLIKLLDERDHLDAKIVSLDAKVAFLNDLIKQVEHAEGAMGLDNVGNGGGSPAPDSPVTSGAGR